jgi:hypothetical protein
MASHTMQVLKNEKGKMNHSLVLKYGSSISGTGGSGSSPRPNPR